MEQDPRFDIYISAYARARIEKKVKKLFLNPRLKMQAANLTPERFELFLFVSIDIEHKKNALFTHMLLQACIDNDISIITNLDIAFADKLLLLRDDMEINQILLEKTRSTCNQALVAVVYLFILYYAQNKR